MDQIEMEAKFRDINAAGAVKREILEFVRDVINFQTPIATPARAGTVTITSARLDEEGHIHTGLRLSGIQESEIQDISLTFHVTSVIVLKSPV